MDLIRRNLLWVALGTQLLLLAPRLDLLPLWDDERYTLETARRSFAGIVRAVQVDVHPPLYYFLVRGWLRLPLPGSELERTRALAALAALAATALFGRLWLGPLTWDQRALFLGLWVFSPCLLLYGRMARSYTLQLALAVIAIRWAQDWLHDPGNRRLQIRYVAAAVLLLYTHYLPGLAVVAGTAALGLWRGQRRQLAALGWIGLLYLPWIATLARTASLVAATKPYWVATHWAVEHALKLAYLFVAFQFGETLPVWAAAVGLVLLPVLGRALWRAWRASPHPPVLFLLLAGVGYLVAASWVSFAFVGARLLFLLPFYYLFLLRGLEVRRAWGTLAYAALLMVDLGGLASYYRRQDFLNKGYLVDFEAIVRFVRERTLGRRAFVLLDRFSTSAGYTLHGPELPYVEILGTDEARERAVARISHDRPELVWYIHYTRQIQRHGRIEERLEPDYRVERHGFVPYSGLDRWAMGLAGLADRPAYVVEVVELRRRGPPVSP